MRVAGRIRVPAVRSAAGLPLVTVLALLAGTALTVLLVRVARHDAPDPGNSPGDLVVVGLVPGESVPAYLTGARRELERLTDPTAPAAGDTWALVSLDRYETPAHVAALLAGAASAQVYARVPLAGVQTPVERIPVLRLPEDATSGMLDAALRRDQEQAEYLQLARGVKGDGLDAERARQAYGTEADTAAQEAAAYRAGCACVFAAVIRAAPAGLQQIADRPGVRAVDPAPEVRSLDDTEFRPVRPEEAGEASITMPAPSGTSGIATHAATPLLSSLGAAVTSTSSSGSASLATGRT